MLLAGSALSLTLLAHKAVTAAAAAPKLDTEEYDEEDLIID